ncbi:ParB/RepB/Spo0J family partition protein [Sphingosinicella microcystinivorans]|uniref:Chromosome partitioning protein ParB n=1 Tax=Sphingosinicella microcystinivorans TaxID=335406 RepID=A0AAD1G017_SPHMI|nr:ParB/RepB/Spo0J family partition protein [Sphingosinicella microcystinivorans]RKS85564.1 chromosome segregation DNA-binding protein [Sphingosinicella microcystinivorans]BBE33145.1 chromosome partitioning protein ParB [Sphingosinicella microcystinivorans]
MSQPKRPTGLGRGLSALLEEMGSAALPPRTDTAAAPAVPAGDAGSSMGAQMLPMAMISPNPKQPRRRFDETAQAELIASVKRQGLLQPILVRPVDGGRFEIVAGERRWRAAQAAQLHDVPVLVRRLTDEEAFEVALVENIQRQDLNAIEEAEGYKRLIEDYGHTQEDIARIVGKSRSHIANLVRLLELPDDVRELLIDGRLTMGHARALLTAPDPSALARDVVQMGLSVREVEARAKKPRAARSKVAPRAAARSADLESLEGQLAEQLGLRVRLEFDGEGGKLILFYSDLDQLDMLCQRLSGERF